ncbi:MAG: DnaJ domain-containing protein [Deltaproteobacteria bacterium]|nr:DnaJ domain-containing protein [Deltaproteobacteria bacterium]MBW2383142.1 DnaJ domain-containing protein [Deltaproteobacteria bacterium]
MSSPNPPVPESGQLTETPLSRLLLDLHRSRFEGTLTIRSGRQEKRIVFDKGYPVETDSNLTGESLAQLLADRGLISAEDRERVVDQARDQKCRQSAAVLSLELLDARSLLAALKDQTRSRIMQAFGWPGGEFMVEAGEQQVEAVQALRTDPLPIVRDAIAAHWPIERILSDLMPRMDQYAVPGKHFAEIAERVADEDEQRMCLARMDGEHPLGRALGASASSPAVAAMVWVVEAMSGLEFHDEAVREDDDGTPRFDSDIEIHVEGAGGADQGAARAGGGKGGAKKSGGDDDAKAEALRAEIEKLHDSLDVLDYYRLLGVKSDARGSAIKKAYFKTAKRFHPDTLARLGLEDLKDQAAEVFAQIAEAFGVLSNARRRKDYDAVMRGELTDLDATRLAQAETSYRKGEILIRMGDFAGALEYLQPAVDIWPDEGIYQSTLGWALYKQAASDPASARTHLARGIALSPQDAVAHFRLATVLRSMGEENEAREALAIAKALDPEVG